MERGSLNALRDPDSFGHWLRRLVVNACLNHRRSAWRYRRVAAAAGRLEDAYPGPETVVLQQDAIGLSGQEIAETLGIPAGTVRSRLHTAMAALRVAVARDDSTSNRDLAKEQR